MELLFVIWINLGYFVWDYPKVKQNNSAWNKQKHKRCTSAVIYEKNISNQTWIMAK